MNSESSKSAGNLVIQVLLFQSVLDFPLTLAIALHVGFLVQPVAIFADHNLIS